MFLSLRGIPGRHQGDESLSLWQRIDICRRLKFGFVALGSVAQRAFWGMEMLRVRQTKVRRSAGIPESGVDECGIYLPEDDTKAGYAGGDALTTGQADTWTVIEGHRWRRSMSRDGLLSRRGRIEMCKCNGTKRDVGHGRDQRGTCTCINNVYRRSMVIVEIHSPSHHPKVDRWWTRLDKTTPNF